MDMQTCTLAHFDAQRMEEALGALSSSHVWVVGRAGSGHTRACELLARTEVVENALPVVLRPGQSVVVMALPLAAPELLNYLTALTPGRVWSPSDLKLGICEGYVITRPESELAVRMDLR